MSVHSKELKKGVFLGNEVEEGRILECESRPWYIILNDSHSLDLGIREKYGGGCTLWPLGITTALGWVNVWSVTSCQPPYIHYIKEGRPSEVLSFVLLPPFQSKG